MADKKISELSLSALPLAGTEELAIVQSGSTKKVAVSNLLSNRTVNLSEGTAKSIGGDLSLVQGAMGIRFNDAVSALTPTTNSLNNDGNIDLGYSNIRWKNLYLAGNVIVNSGKGIDFSADGQAAGMTSELLDDYEEGTWTPTYEGSAGSIGATAYAERAGYYTKIGNRVILTGIVSLSNNGDWTGNARIGGLPFNGSLASGAQAIGSVEMRNVTTTGAYVVAELGRTSNTKIALINTNSGSGSTGVSTADVPDNGAFLFTITYLAA